MRLAAAAVAAFAALSMASCGRETEPRAVALVGLIDERSATVRNVGIGSSKARIATVLGSYGVRSQAYPSEPADADDDDATGGPWSVVTGPHHLGPGGPSGEQVTLRYPGAAFFVRQDRVFGFLISAKDAYTLAGVGVGDDLSRVRERYPRFRCEGASRSDTSAIQAPSCSGSVRGDRFVYFGGDPIESVTVMEHGLSHYAY